MTQELKKGESWRRGYQQGYDEARKELLKQVLEENMDFMRKYANRPLPERKDAFNEIADLNKLLREKFKQ